MKNYFYSIAASIFSFNKRKNRISKISAAIISLIFSAIAVSCSYGIVYRKHTEPGMMGSAENKKSARACIRSYLYIVTTGNATMNEIRNKEGIAKISSVDHEFTEILSGLLLRRYCILVSGE